MCFGPLGSGACSSFARRRKNASVAPCGMTRTVQVPAAGSSAKASTAKTLLPASDAATAPDGSIRSSWKLSSREGVSRATRRRLPPRSDLQLKLGARAGDAAEPGVGDVGARDLAAGEEARLADGEVERRGGGGSSGDQQGQDSEQGGFRHAGTNAGPRAFVLDPRSEPRRPAVEQTRSGDPAGGADHPPDTAWVPTSQCGSRQAFLPPGRGAVPGALG